MGDPSSEITEEKQDAAQVEKSKAMHAVTEGILLIIICYFYQCFFVCVSFSEIAICLTAQVLQVGWMKP